MMNFLKNFALCTVVSFFCAVFILAFGVGPVLIAIRAGIAPLPYGLLMVIAFWSVLAGVAFAAELSRIEAPDNKVT